MDSDPTSESPGVDDEDDLAEINGHPIAPEPSPYHFDPADLPVAISVVYAAFSTTLDGFLAASAIADAAAARNLPNDSPLVREAALAASYPLRFERTGRAGCSLGPATGDGTAAWPPAIRSVEEPAVALWRALASAVAEPAAIARFEDLLFCRRDGNGRTRAMRAAEVYLHAAEREDIDMDAVEAIVRAWSLARSVREEALEARIRQVLAEVADEVLTDVPGERPGVVLPMLGALAEGPIGADRSRQPDPIDVDGLLTRAASAFSRGYLASEVAGYRRARTQDWCAYEIIGRAEVAAYLREAEGSANPAVRMHHLEAAARVARARGLPEPCGKRRLRCSASSRPSGAEARHGDRVASSLRARVLAPQFTRSPDWRGGMGWFLAGDPPSGEVRRLKDYERNTRGGLRRVFASTTFSSEGLPRATTGGDDDQAAHEMSFAARISAEYIGGMIAEGLRRMASHYGVPGEGDLVELFPRLGGRRRAARSLAKASGISGMVTTSPACTLRRRSSRPQHATY